MCVTFLFLYLIYIVINRYYIKLLFVLKRTKKENILNFFHDQFNSPSYTKVIYHFLTQFIYKLTFNLWKNYLFFLEIILLKY